METDWLSSFLQTGLRLQLPECSVFSVSRRCSSLRSLLLSLLMTPPPVSTNPSRVLSSWGSWGAILSTCRGNPAVLLGMVSRDIQRGPSPVPTPFIAVCPSYTNSCALIGDFCCDANFSCPTGTTCCANDSGCCDTGYNCCNDQFGGCCPVGSSCTVGQDSCSAGSGLGGGSGGGSGGGTTSVALTIGVPSSSPVASPSVATTSSKAATGVTFSTSAAVVGGGSSASPTSVSGSGGTSSGGTSSGGSSSSGGLTPGKSGASHNIAGLSTWHATGLAVIVGAPLFGALL
ncbi:hypothetical protein SCLCIDRAFT_344719 [Scleroderma citrinum Foug A]|uniref:Granulins domain-containing protein n=1 Tax=Scleroderma citrinum Foug A TaxID=1036808 RepID=A0A0C2YYP1_9AGAM|nr:hypothetical protein SCLCIDRAFT_344719 [Scleroderma citrinum Foug A]